MKVHDHCDCSCHGPDLRGGHGGHGGHDGHDGHDGVAAPPSTGFFVLSLSLALLMCGLISTGVIPLRFW